MKVADIRVSFQLWARHPSDNTALPLRVAESQLMMSDRQVDHGADAPTSIRQARRARAHRRRQCQTLCNNQLKWGIIAQINPAFGLEVES